MQLCVLDVGGAHRGRALVEIMCGVCFRFTVFSIMNVFKERGFDTMVFCTVTNYTNTHTHAREAQLSNHNMDGWMEPLCPPSVCRSVCSQRINDVV